MLFIQEWKVRKKRLINILELSDLMKLDRLRKINNQEIYEISILKLKCDKGYEIRIRKNKNTVMLFVLTGKNDQVNDIARSILARVFPDLEMNWLL